MDLQAFSAVSKTVDSVVREPDVDRPSFKVRVADDQLSLAIGKEGQNARLAAKLTGCKIDINPETETDEVIDYGI